MKKQLTIGFDINPASMPTKTGIGYYAYLLLDNLAKNYPDVHFVAYYYNLLGRKGRPDLPDHSNITYRVIRVIPGKAMNKLRRFGVNIPVEILLKQKVDAVIYTNYLGHPSWIGALSVPVIHDMTYLLDPDSMSATNQKDLERFVPRTIRRSRIIVGISNSTLATIQENYNTKDKTLVCTYIPPVSPLKVSPRNIQDTVQSFGIKQPYYLFIGTLEPRKNLISVVHAHQSSSFLKSKYTLVLVGKTDWKHAEIAKKLEAARKEGCRIVTTGYVTDLQKSALLAGADLYVMPSTYEGFGMPILEALSQGIPVAISDIPVFREVAKGAAAYFNPKDPADVANTLERVLKDKAEQKRIVLKGNELLKTYDWKDIAASLMNAIRTQIGR